MEPLDLSCRPWGAGDVDSMGFPVVVSRAIGPASTEAMRARVAMARGMGCILLGWALIRLLAAKRIVELAVTRNWQSRNNDWDGEDCIEGSFRRMEIQQGSL